jgi:hypothetical protein
MLPSRQGPVPRGVLRRVGLQGRQDRLLVGGVQGCGHSSPRKPREGAARSAAGCGGGDVSKLGVDLGRWLGGGAGRGLLVVGGRISVDGGWQLGLVYFLEVATGWGRVDRVAGDKARRRVILGARGGGKHRQQGY